ncbi:ABC transporter permease [Neobacillus niacini]|uniref:ABC transporter permease n=1 Tax=Neobacillus niacini TaxID=86668 RepID=UPI0030001D3C
MSLIYQVLREQFANAHLIWRLAIYDMKSRYQMHYLGVLWQFLGPMLQILVYWFVIGIGIRGGGGVEGQPYFVWLVVGLIPWFFINRSILQGSGSIIAKVNLVSKMNFPVSVLPTINIVSNTFNFMAMFFIMWIILIFNNKGASIYLLQLPYYMIALYILLFSLTLFGSTIALFVRDFQMVLPPLMRIIFYLSPVLWDTSNFSEAIQTALKLNPFYYIVVGFRSSILGGEWFYQDVVYTVYFWSFTFFILLIGSLIHVKFRDKFVDYI